MDAHAADPVKRGDHVQVVGVGTNLEVEVTKVAGIADDERSPGASAARDGSADGRSSRASRSSAADASRDVSDLPPPSEEERT